MGLRDRLRRRQPLGPYAGEDPIERVLAEHDVTTGYYALCARYARSDGVYVTKPEVAKVVEALGEDFGYAKVDRSWTLQVEVDGDPLVFTFVLQHGCLVEMLLSHGRRGSNFAVMARRIVEQSGGTVPYPPNPRPVVKNASELYEVLRFGCDAFHDVERGL